MSIIIQHEPHFSQEFSVIDVLKIAWASEVCSLGPFGAKQTGVWEADLE